MQADTCYCCLEPLDPNEAAYHAHYKGVERTLCGGCFDDGVLADWAIEDFERRHFADRIETDALGRCYSDADPGL